MMRSRMCAWTAAILGLLAGARGPALAAPGQARASDEPLHWYYDAETALQVARDTGRPIVLLKVRADIGEIPKT
jgi:hypothetical protein